MSFRTLQWRPFIVVFKKIIRRVAGRGLKYKLYDTTHRGCVPSNTVMISSRSTRNMCHWKAYFWLFGQTCSTRLSGNLLNPKASSAQKKWLLLEQSNLLYGFLCSSKTTATLRRTRLTRFYGMWLGSPLFTKCGLTFVRICCWVLLLNYSFSSSFHRRRTTLFQQWNRTRVEHQNAIKHS